MLIPFPITTLFVVSSLIFPCHPLLKWNHNSTNISSNLKLSSWQDMSLNTMSNFTNQQSSLRPTYVFFLRLMF